MYERHFGLRARPFSILPQAEFLYPSRRHRMALELLSYGITTRAPFVVISGEIGTGKTTLLRCLSGRIPGDTLTACVEHAHGGYSRLLRWIAEAFALSAEDADDFAIERRVIAHVRRQARFGRGVMLAIDEAQGLSSEALEQLRMLSNVNGSERTEFQVVLVGQPALRERLREPGLRQLAQRVAVDYDLEALDAGETRAYIRHRLRVAGAGDDGLFDDAACDAVHAHTGGVPRLVNLTCDFALLYAYSARQQRVSRDTVEEVAQDRKNALAQPVPDAHAPALLRRVSPGIAVGGSSHRGEQPEQARKE
jgi:type II secretory pathway predicted ATPase ExeA